MNTNRSLNDLAEAKGKQELYTRQSPQMLKALREIALIQCLESPYQVLHASSQRWHDSKHDLLPWLNHFLAIIRRAYGEFEGRAGQVKAPRGAKTALVEAAIDAQPGLFSVAEIRQACPGVSLDMIRHLLQRLKGKKVECVGRGHTAK